MQRLGLVFALIWCLRASAEEVIPPAPKAYCNDYANVVSAAAVTRLNTTLAHYEKETSNQIVVAVFPKMQSHAPIKDYTRRMANAWGVGQKGKNNGVSLFVFIQDHKMYVTVGTGLEKALPEAACQHILDTDIIPRFKQKDFDGGLSAGVTAIIAATTGACQGNGHTAAEATDSSPAP